MRRKRNRRSGMRRGRGRIRVRTEKRFKGQKGIKSR
jgi:hypothetical protein